MRRLQRLLQMLGAAGVLGLGVLTVCVAFYYSAVAPAEREVHAQDAAAERFKSRSPVQTVAAGTSISADLWRFQSLFPQVGRLADELERVYSMGRNVELELQQAEGRLEARDSGLTAYRVTLPIRGSYPQIREFINTVLKEMPIASIDALRFERKKIGETQLDAQIQITIHFRSQTETDTQ